MRKESKSPSTQTRSTTLSLSSTEQHNPEFDGSQSIKVAVRLRPLSERETSTPAKSKSFTRSIKRDEGDNFRAWTVLPGPPQAIVQKSGRKIEGKSLFRFDSVFGEGTSTREVYETIARPVVQGVVRGQHGTIFAYGQTGSGKTHTMTGKEPFTSNDGVIQMVANDLFQKVAKHPNREFSVSVSFIEIYNEKVYELLPASTELSDNPSVFPQGNSTSPPAASSTLTVREDPRRGGVFVNCREVIVKDEGSLVEQLLLGSRNRVVASTDMNIRTSRSHAIFRITVESREKTAESKEANTFGDNRVVRVSSLNLVDLAGSENSSSAGTSGVRHRETGKINQSLLALSQVINALSLPPHKRPTHINYRDSKLTRILQSSLSGNALMAILCCATTSRLYVEETRSTLKFAARAKRIQTDAKINEVVDDGALIERLQRELTEARLALDALEKREEKAENTTSEAAEELKQLKSILFGGDEFPEFATNAPRQQRHRRHAPSSGKSTQSAPVVENMLPRGLSRTPERSHAFLANLDETESYDHSDFERLTGRATMSEQAARQGSIFSELRSNRYPSSTGGRRSQQFDLPQSADFNARTAMPQPPPGEVIVMKEGLGVAGTWGHASLEYKLQDAEQRVRFLESKLELSEDLAESLFKDIEDAKRCIHQLVFKNVDFIAKIRRLKEQLHSEEREADTLVMQQYNLLKFSMYFGLVLFLFGQHELFFATVMFIWLSLEAYT